VFKKIKKREGRIVHIDSSKITTAIAGAGKATGAFGDKEAENLTLRVLSLAHQLHISPIPEVEEVQDMVERILLDSPFHRSAKAYIIYREQHTKISPGTNRQFFLHIARESSRRPGGNIIQC